MPDVRFAFAALLEERPEEPGDVRLDPMRVGVVGHSFGGWTALATPEQEPRVRAVVALAPAGASRPRPGILPVALSFRWGRDVPTMVLAGDEDVMTPLDGVTELFERAPEPKRMVVVRGADHLHFVDDVQTAHESLRRQLSPVPPSRTAAGGDGAVRLRDHLDRLTTTSTALPRHPNVPRTVRL